MNDATSVSCEPIPTRFHSFTSSEYEPQSVGFQGNMVKVHIDSLSAPEQSHCMLSFMRRLLSAELVLNRNTLI